MWVSVAVGWYHYQWNVPIAGHQYVDSSRQPEHVTRWNWRKILELLRVSVDSWIDFWISHSALRSSLEFCSPEKGEGEGAQKSGPGLCFIFFKECGQCHRGWNRCASIRTIRLTKESGGVGLTYIQWYGPTFQPTAGTECCQLWTMGPVENGPRQAGTRDKVCRPYNTAIRCPWTISTWRNSIVEGDDIELYIVI